MSATDPSWARLVCYAALGAAMHQKTVSAFDAVLGSESRSDQSNRREENSGESEHTGRVPPAYDVDSKATNSR